MAHQAARQGAERRQHSRAELKTAINFGSDSNFYTGFTSDISEGGVFVATHTPLPVGSMIDLEFSIPDDGPPIRVKGEVRWSAEYNEMSDGHPGLGVRFVGLTGADKQRIDKFVKVREALFYDDD